MLKIDLIRQKARSEEELLAARNMPRSGMMTGLVQRQPESQPTTT